MKNIQIIDGALNCTFSIFQATDEEFLMVFPDPSQDMEYAEDIEARPNSEEVFNALLEHYGIRLNRKGIPKDFRI
jgi:hypothetical protein